MTIKTPINTDTGQNVEPEINVPNESEIGVPASAASEAEINVQASESSPPLAFATALDNPLPDPSVPTAYATSMSAPIETVGAASAATTTSTNVHVPPPATSVVTPGTRPPPPGAPDGGRWVMIKHVGNDTWMICAIVSLIFCWILCFPCGVWALCCPCDQKLAYECPRGQLYDESGQRIQGARRSR